VKPGVQIAPSDREAPLSELKSGEFAILDCLPNGVP
jgi:hypothetical protein